MAPEPIYKPMKPWARVFWAAVTIGAFWLCIHNYIAVLASA